MLPKKQKTVQNKNNDANNRNKVVQPQSLIKAPSFQKEPSFSELLPFCDLPQAVPLRGGIPETGLSNCLISKQTESAKQPIPVQYPVNACVSLPPPLKTSKLRSKPASRSLSINKRSLPISKTPATNQESDSLHQQPQTQSEEKSKNNSSSSTLNQHRSLPTISKRKKQQPLMMNFSVGSKNFSHRNGWQGQRVNSGQSVF